MQFGLPLPCQLQCANRIFVHDQQPFRKGQVIIIHEFFVAQIIDFGSLVLDRNLDQTFPCGCNRSRDDTARNRRYESSKQTIHAKNSNSGILQSER